MHIKKHTEETKRKISENRKGKTSGINHPMWGKKHKPESITKMILAKIGKKLSEENKKNISKALKGKIPKHKVGGWNKGKKLSKKHRKALSLAHIGKQTGENNPNWKGGVSKLNKTERRLEMETIKYKEWRSGVFERDTYTCRMCGKHGVKIEADHIKSWSTFPKLRYKLSNGQTLCVKCHREKTRNELKANWKNQYERKNIK